MRRSYFILGILGLLSACSQESKVTALTHEQAKSLVAQQLKLAEEPCFADLAVAETFRLDSSDSSAAAQIEKMKALVAAELFTVQTTTQKMEEHKTQASAPVSYNYDVYDYTITALGKTFMRQGRLCYAQTQALEVEIQPDVQDPTAAVLEATVSLAQPAAWTDRKDVQAAFPELVTVKEKVQMKVKYLNGAWQVAS